MLRHGNFLKHYLLHQVTLPKLLKNLRNRNPSLAKELTESCISFESIWDLDDEGLKTVVSQIKPAILGLALSLVHTKNQRRALSLISREMALKAFEIMQQFLKILLWI